MEWKIAQSETSQIFSLENGCHHSSDSEMGHRQPDEKMADKPEVVKIPKLEVLHQESSESEKYVQNPML